MTLEEPTAWKKDYSESLPSLLMEGALEKPEPLPTAASLFAQLREIGVLCGTCARRVPAAPREKGCRHSLRFSHLCGAWEPSPSD